MAKSLSDAEVARYKRRIPGLEVDVDGLGHRFDSPHGRIWMRGVKLTDEVFESETFGTLNISHILRNIEGADVPLQPLDINENLLRNVSRIDINVAYAKRLSKQQLNAPILAVFASDGLNVIDGAHRIWRLNRDHKKTVYARLLRPEILEYARVKRLVQRVPDGEWEPFDTVSDDDVRKEVEGGVRFIERLQRTGGLIPR